MYKRNQFILPGGVLIRMCAKFLRPQKSRDTIFLDVHDKPYQLNSYRPLRTIMELPQLAEWN
jgi:hypothetical protein